MTTPLPVQLVSFNAQLQENKTVLASWATASEVNCASFTVEKSKDGSNFESVSTVPGNGTTSQPHSYSVVDENPFVGVSYYRLKETDYDGSYTYSSLRPVSYYPTDEVSIGNFSLGSTNSFVQVVSKSQGEANVDIYDVTGRKMYSKDINLAAGVNNINIENSLTKGVYILRVVTTSGNIAQKKVLAWK
jgi:hypothetical protein